MKALSVRQPWASLLVDGSKSIEFMPWETDYRGELLICAGSKGDACYGQLLDGLNDEMREKVYDRMPLGVALGIVTLVDVKPFGESDMLGALAEEMPGASGYAWVVRNPRKITPFPVDGKPRLFEVNYQP